MIGPNSPHAPSSIGDSAQKPTEAPLCAHCGLPVPAAIVSREARDQFCCSGCAGAWQFLNQCGLGEFYTLRDAYQSTAPSPVRVSGKDYTFLDDPELQARFSQGAVKGGLRMKLFLDGVHCVACSWLIEKVLVEREGAAFVELNLGKSTLDLVFNPAHVKLSRLAAVLDRLGYTPHLLGTDEAGERAGREGRAILARMGIAAACAANIMLLSISSYAGESTGMDAGVASLFRWISLGLALPALTYSAWPFYRGAWGGLRNGLLHMDLPISLGIVAALVISVVATIRESAEVYYDSATMLVFFLLAGRYVLQRATQKAYAAGDRLLHLEAKTARIVKAAGEREVDLSEVHAGDRIRVLPGESVPIDGILEGTGGWLTEAHLTGESEPARKLSGDAVYAGSTVTTSPIVIVATAVGEATRMRRLADLMQSASFRRAPVVALTDRIAGYFVGGVLLTAIATGVVWYFLDSEMYLWRAAAVLVVTCPCALAIATPVTLAVAMGRAARAGIFIKGADGVERLSKVRHVILDKTGTLTHGQLQRVQTIFSLDLSPIHYSRTMRDVAAIERQSGHVYATAFEDVSVNGLHASDVTLAAGEGVSGTVEGRAYVVGTENYLAKSGILIPDSLGENDVQSAKRTQTRFYVGLDGEAVASIVLGDEIHAESASAVQRIVSREIEVEMLSGDDPLTVEAVAKEVGVSTFAGRVSPEAKLARVEALESNGICVAMAGDGVNDAAALSRATVGISAAGSADIARNAADVFISKAGPAAIASALCISRRAMNIVRLNIGIGIAYNLAGAALAITGLVSPLLAAVLMPVSSLTALLIASRA